MNNDLEQFSEERLKDMQEHVTAGMTLGHADALLIRQAIDIALSAKQAKAIGYVESKTAGTDRFILKGFYEQNINIGDSLYTTPQPAHTEQVIPDGWKLVPIEPTQGMVDACFEATSAGGIQKGYRAMLAAAPKPESE